MKRGKPLKRTRKARSNAENAAHAHFRATVLQEPCLFSETRPGHQCRGPLDPHHVLPQQTLKAHFSTLPDEEKWPLIHDPANGVALCRYESHDPVTTKFDHIALEELPARVIDFAEAHGLRWRLDRECPSIHSEEAV